MKDFSTIHSFHADASVLIKSPGWGEFKNGARYEKQDDALQDHRACLLHANGLHQGFLFFSGEVWEACDDG